MQYPKNTLNAFLEEHCNKHYYYCNRCKDEEVQVMLLPQVGAAKAEKNCLE